MASHPDERSGFQAEVYFLKTERLGFRAWTPEDFPFAWSLWGIRTSPGSSTRGGG